MTATRTSLNRRALGRELTKLSNATAAELLLRPLTLEPTSRARRIGITGAPGAGKSTLTGQLAMLRLRSSQLGGQRLGVLAVDPSSPKTGGAILGDRIRMDELAGSAELYIRSVGSRTATDGLSDNLPEMLDVFDTHGFDEILLETVGVGQAEYAARRQVDTLVLVLLPDSGDAVQAMKAGIMEMADIFVVNKADLPGAQRMVADIQRIAALSKYAADDWRPPVVLTSVQQEPSIRQLSDVIDQHQQWLRQSHQGTSLVDERARYRIRRIIERRLSEAVRNLQHAQLQTPLLDQVDWVLSQIRSAH